MSKAIERDMRLIQSALAEKAAVFTRLKDQYMALQKDKAEMMKELAELREKYNELIFAVGNKYPNETRHQTALRYILERENGSTRAAVEGGIRDELQRME